MAINDTKYKGDMLFESEMGNHKLQIDVPAGMEGSDREPTPPQVSIASLGLMANYSQRYEVDIDGMTVKVNFKKADEPTRLTNLKASIDLPPAECAKDREKVIKRVAEHCPVHETINTLEGFDFVINEPEPVEPA